MIYDDYDKEEEENIDKKVVKNLTDSIDTLQAEIDSLSSLVEQYKQNLQSSLIDIDNSSKTRDDQLDTALQAGLFEASEALHDFAEELSTSISTETLVASLGRITEIIAESATISNIIGDLTGNVEGHLVGTADLVEATIEQLNLVNEFEAETAHLSQVVSDRLTVDKIDASEISTDNIKLNSAEGLQERTPVQTSGLIKMTIPIYKGLVVIKSDTYALTVHNNTLVTWNMTTTDFAIKRIDFTKNNFGKIMSTDIYLSSSAPYKVLFLGDGEAVETTTEYSDPVELNVSTVQGTITSVPVTLPDSELLLSAYIVDEMPEDMLPNTFYMVATESSGNNGTWYFDGVTRFKIAPDAFNPVVESITPEQIYDTTDEPGEEFDYLSVNDIGIEWRERIHLRDSSDYTEPAEPDTLMDVGTLRHYNGQWITEQPQPTGRFLPPYTVAYGSTEYSNIPDNEWTVLFSDPMDFTINKTQSLKVKVSDYGQTKEYVKTAVKRLVDGSVDWELFLVDIRGWTKTTEGTDNIYTAPYTTDDGWAPVLYKKSGDIWYLVTKLRIKENGYIVAYSNGTIISTNSPLIEREVQRGTTDPEVIGTVERTEGSTENPITKLGVVDEGTWIAGDVTTPNLLVKDSMEVKPQTIKWHNKDYQVWLDGEEPTANDLDWVEV